MNTMWAVSLSGLLGKMTRTHPRLNLVTNAKNLILKKETCYEGGIYQNDFLHQHVLQLDQGGLTLSSREQYLNKVLLNK